MKASIVKRISGARLRDAVPPRYRDEVAKTADPSGTYTLILCPHTERDVVTSPLVARALERVVDPGESGIVIVGTVFTDEALQLAGERGARVVALRKAKWTDASARLRQLPPEPP